MKRNIITCAFMLFMLLCFSQTKTNYNIHTVAFYNLENLFDTIDNPTTKDEYSPILQTKSNKSKIYFEKIEHMAFALSEIGKETTKNSASILAIAEVENDTVINDLLSTAYLKNKGYDYIHKDSPDWRGIDVALIYKQHHFSPVNYNAHKLIAWNTDGYRVNTRYQLVVSGYLEDELIYLIIVHWPSQRSGKKKTNILREKSAELTLSIIDSIRSETTNPKIIILGDYNENPNDKNVKSIIGTKVDSYKFHNPFENLFKKGFGTLGYRDQMNLFDQIILSTNMTSKNYNNYQLYKAGIFNPNYLTTKFGKYKGYPYRSFSNGTFTGGFSDHYPVYIYLIKQNNH